MSFSAHTSPEQTDEPTESPNVTRQQALRLAGLMRVARRIVVFTGAGVSTASGIKDYRSGTNTRIKTGPGHWTLQKQKEDQRHAAAITAGASPTVSDELSLTKAKAKGGLSRKKRKCSSADSEGAPTRQVESELTPPKEGAADGVVIDEYDAEMQQAMMSAIPSYAHMALVELQRRGLLHGVITQNTDGLHHLSGLRRSSLCELHGSTTYVECIGCQRRYHQDQFVLASDFHQQLTTTDMERRRRQHLARVDPQSEQLRRLVDQDDTQLTAEEIACLNQSDHFSGHYTGHFCVDAKCRAPLVDVVIEFGQNLYDDDQAHCMKLGKDADLILVLGSSLKVDPARQIVYDLRNNKKLAIVNLQRTSNDSDASVRSFAEIDVFFRQLMPLLTSRGIDVPTFQLQRHVRVRQRRGRSFDECEVTVDALMDPDETDTKRKDETIATIRQVQFSLPHKAARLQSDSASSFSPLQLDSSVCHVEAITGAHSQTLRSRSGLPIHQAMTGEIQLRLTFFGHRGEPVLDLSVPLKLHTQSLFSLTFDPDSRAWRPTPPPVVTPLTAQSATRGRHRSS